MRRDTDVNTEERRAQLAASLAKVRGRISAACEAAGRQRGEITVIAVTKTFPAADVIALAGLGVREVGENRDQEAAAKAADVAAAGVSVRWHFVGQLQRNKCRSVVRYADLIHSVDRQSVVDALAAAAEGHRAEPLDVLIQVSLDDDPVRGGVPVSQLPSLAAAVARRDTLRLRGLMAVPPLGAEPGPHYRRLARVAAQVRDKFPEATVLSAGMSGDLEAAIAHGATHLRIGSALLGSRALLG